MEEQIITTLALSFAQIGSGSFRNMHNLCVNGIFFSMLSQKREKTFPGQAVIFRITALHPPVAKNQLSAADGCPAARLFP